MSATRDKTQKVTFVYSNLYQIYRKGKDAATAAPISATHAAPSFSVPATSGRVLKADDLRDSTFAQIRNHAPVELLANRVLVAKPEVIKQIQTRSQSDSQADALASLKDNLKSLNNLHARLRFMLKELEDLVKE